MTRWSCSMKSMNDTFPPMEDLSISKRLNLKHASLLLENYGAGDFLKWSSNQIFFKTTTRTSSINFLLVNCHHVRGYFFKNLLPFENFPTEILSTEINKNCVWSTFKIKLSFLQSHRLWTFNQCVNRRFLTCKTFLKTNIFNTCSCAGTYFNEVSQKL